MKWILIVWMWSHNAPEVPAAVAAFESEELCLKALKQWQKGSQNSFGMTIAQGKCIAGEPLGDE